MSAAERVGTFVHDSPEWHAARASGIGASEIAAVVNLSPYESPFSLWHRKAGLIGPPAVNDEMRWGHYLEPAIAKRYADGHSWLRVRRTGTWRSRMRPWQLANPDRLVSGLVRLEDGSEVRWRNIPLEIKWSPNGDGWSRELEGIPVYYRCQLQWQMDVMGADFGILAALVGSDYREYHIIYDPTDVELLRKAGQEFMDSLAAGEAPDIDDTGHTYQALRELHPDIDGSTVEIDAHLAGQFRGARAAVEEAKDREQHARNLMLAAMGTARYAEFDDETIARRQPSGGGRVALYEVPPPKTKETIKEAVQA